MYTATINGLDLGGSKSVKGLKKRVEDFAATYSGYVWAVIKSGSKTYATYDGKSWERYISCDEIRRKQERKQIEACKRDIRAADWTIEAHEILKEKYGAEIFTKALSAA